MSSGTNNVTSGGVNLDNAKVFYSFGYVRKVPAARIPTYRQFDVRIRHTDRARVLNGESLEFYVYVREVSNGKLGKWQGAHKRSPRAAEICDHVFRDARAHDQGTRDMVASWV